MASQKKTAHRFSTFCTCIWTGYLEMTSSQTSENHTNHSPTKHKLHNTTVTNATATVTTLALLKCACPSSTSVSWKLRAVLRKSSLRDVASVESLALEGCDTQCQRISDGQIQIRNSWFGGKSITVPSRNHTDSFLPNSSCASVFSSSCTAGPIGATRTDT